MELERMGAGGMGSRMETFEQIRRDRDREGLSIRALAERHGVHRRAVRQALVSPLPPVKRSPVARPTPKARRVRGVIDAWLMADRDAPRKQRHTARGVSGSAWSPSTARGSPSARSAATCVSAAPRGARRGR
jgi:transcriptional regulator with XRE-family HTH domain